MKKIYSSLLFALACSVCGATNYYVDAVNGSNGYSGTSPAQAFQTIQTAANITAPGDTVFIMNGTYTSSGTVLNIGRSGDASAQIVYTAYPGHSPKLQATVNTYNIVSIAAGISYITINGLEIEGWGVNMSLAADSTAAKNQVTCPVARSAATAQNPLNKYNQNGIFGDSRSLGANAGSTHIVISKCVVHDCGGGGIAVNQCDYITYDGNTVYNCAWYSIYGCSGITINNHYNSDNATPAYKNYIVNNVTYNNRMYVLWRSVCQITDGNGIILDVPNTGYTGRTLVVNNLSFNNGGSGIHSFKFSHADIFNNVGYYNSQSPEISSGEIYARNADDIKIINNILVSAPGEIVSGNYSNTNITQDYNIYYGGSSVDAVGTHSLLQDPKFVNPSTNAAVANFRVQPRSVAINNGDNANTTATDKQGTARPISTAVEIGAYEVAAIGAFNSTGTQQTKILGTGGGTGEPGAGAYYGPYDSRPGSANQKSRHAIIYPQALLSSGTAVPANSIINSLQFRRGANNPGTSTPSTQGVPANSIVRLYLRNESTDNFGSAAFDWTTILPGASSPAVLVYGGEAAPVIGTSGGGWQTVNFQVPFSYTGGNLGVYIEYIQKGSVASAPDISWMYDNDGSQPLYSTGMYPAQLYATKATATTGTLSTTLSTNNERRPVITVGYYEPTTVLPTTLMRFTAVKRGSGVDLDWLTATEIANAGFAVQRSLSGSDFETLGTVDSKAPGGASTSPIAYAFTDAHPVKGTSHYRLLQKDKDGKEAYSTVVTVRFSDKGLSLLNLYPNPVMAKVAATVYAEGESITTTVSVRDITGRLIRQFKKNVVAGYNRMEVDVTGQTAGVYLLTIETASGEKLIKQFIIN